MENYYIKYAIMQVEKPMEWLTDCSDSMVVANIVSKCYVVGVKFFKDETYHLKYEVVFPYQKKEDTLERVIPSYHNYQYTNTVLVDQLFDSFEEASNEKQIRNKKVAPSLKGLLPLDSHFQKMSTLIDESIEEIEEKYQEIEQMIEKQTTNMIVTKDCLSKEKIFTKRTK